MGEPIQTKNMPVNAVRLILEDARFPDGPWNLYAWTDVKASRRMRRYLRALIVLDPEGDPRV